MRFPDSLSACTGLSCLLLGLTTASASAAVNSLSFQSYTGLLEAPDANVTPEGEIRIQYNNDVESGAAQTGRGAINTAENYAFSIGVWDRIELGGRLAMAYGDTGAPRRRTRTDLSGDFKLRLFDWRHFSVAAGIADFAGEGLKLRARYGVLTTRLPFDAELSLGIGNGPDRLDGVFGGINVPINRFVSLIADYDAEEANYGVRIHHAFANGIALHGTVGGTTATGFDPSLGITLAIPLGLSQSVPSRSTTTDRDRSAHDASVSIVATPENSESNAPTQRTANPENLAYGAESQATTELDGTKAVFVSTDTPRNSLISWHKRDLLGEPEKSDQAAVEYRYGIPLRERTTNGDVRWSSSWRRLHAWLEAPLRIDLRLEPFLRNVVGTETGAFEYSLALDSSARLQLPAGLGGYVTHSASVADSSSFERGGPFANRRIDTSIRELALQWALHPLPGLIAVTTLGETRIEELNYEFTHIDAAWLFGGGTHRLRIAYGDYEPFDDLNFRSRETRLAEYRYFWRKPELLVELQYGEYFFGDTGGKLELTRFFGDIAVHAFYQRDEDSNEMAGFGFTIPLAPNGEQRIGPVVASGAPAWRYDLSTTFNTPDGSNTIRPTALLEPLPRYSLISDVLDRDRAFPNYIH